MITQAISSYLHQKRIGGFFIVTSLITTFFCAPLLDVVKFAYAAEQTCDVTTTFNVVSPGTTITISWRTSGYSQATLNGEVVSVGSGTKTFTVNAHTTYRLEASNGRSGSKCIVSTTVFCRQPAPPITPIDPKPPVDPRDPNPPQPPVTPDPVIPNPPQPPVTPDPPVPRARAYLFLWTEGFMSPLTTGDRTISKDANITSLEWQSVNATRCEARGFSTSGRLIGNITSGQDITLNQGQTKTFSIRCQNAASVWSDWEEVRIIKQANTPAGPNRAPTAPVITGADESTAAAVTGVVNQTLPFTFKATDIDGDRIAYRVDWDANGTVDTVLPVIGLVRSGTPVTHNNVWFAPGSFTFKAQTVDEHGSLSSWTEHSIRINTVPDPVSRPLPPQVYLSVDRNLVRIGDGTTVRLRVLADYEVSCTIYGIDSGSDTVIHRGSASEQEYTYQTDQLLSMQLVRAVCTPSIPGVAMATEVRERRVSVTASIEER